MKILVFSDTHLTDKFDSELFDYIAELVESADQVVINGDFWDGYLTTFDAFCNSQWSNLFPLLKRKQTTYVFGNHDKQEFMDERYNLFSNIQTIKHVFSSGKKNIIIEHGHMIVPAYDARLFFRNNKLVRPFYRAGVHFIEKNDAIRKLQHQSEFDQGLIKLDKFVKEVQKNFVKNNYYIFGHTHVHKIVPEFNVINIGVLQKKRRHHLVIEDGEMQLFPENQQYE